MIFLRKNAEKRGKLFKVEKDLAKRIESKGAELGVTVADDTIVEMDGKSHVMLFLGSCALYLCVQVTW